MAITHRGSGGLRLNLYRQVSQRLSGEDDGILRLRIAAGGRTLRLGHNAREGGLVDRLIQKLPDRAP